VTFFIDGRPLLNEAQEVLSMSIDPSVPYVPVFGMAGE